MKTQITLILLLIVSAFTACKKEKGTQVEIAGKWQVTKVETTTGSATVTYTGTPSDYIEFRRNDNNELVVKLGDLNTIGTYYMLVNNDIKYGYNGKNRAGKVTTINGTKLEFNGTVEGSSPVVTEKYYLSR